MTLEAGELVTETLDYDGREVTVYVPSEQAEAIVYATDGAWHIAGLSAALDSAEVPSTMIVAVHGLGDDDGRLREYVPGFDAERFGAHERFFVDDVTRWVTQRFGADLPADRSAVWGASLGGEFALAMGLRHTDAFGCVLAASPGAGYQPPATLGGSLPRVYLVAGTEEDFFLDNATRWADALRTADADVVMATRQGGHGDPFWTEEFPLMVTWAFGR